MLDKKPFKRYNETKTNDVITIWLNPAERTELERLKYMLQQEKDSTAIKQLMIIGSKLLEEEKTRAINEIILGNYRKNKRLGIVTFD